MHVLVKLSSTRQARWTPPASPPQTRCAPCRWGSSPCWRTRRTKCGALLTFSTRRTSASPSSHSGLPQRSPRLSSAVRWVDHKKNIKRIHTQKRNAPQTQAVICSPWVIGNPETGLDPQVIVKLKVCPITMHTELPCIMYCIRTKANLTTVCLIESRNSWLNVRHLVTIMIQPPNVIRVAFLALQVPSGYHISFSKNAV